MASWDGKQIVRWRPEPYTDYPGWLLVDCGCCNGLEWGGDFPQECRTCRGAGQLAQHESGAIALYAGGPFCGVA